MPVVTAQWGRIQNGNNRPRQGRTRTSKAADPHIGSAAKLFCRPGPNRPAPSTTGHAKREGMAPMQWPDASVEAVAVIEPYVDKNAEQDTAASGIAALFSVANVQAGLDLPCTDGPELFFAEAPADVEAAK